MSESTRAKRPKLHWIYFWLLAVPASYFIACGRNEGGLLMVGAFLGIAAIVVPVILAVEAFSDQ